MGSDGQILATEFMVKRAQMKSRFTTPHYKSRWFVLTQCVLRYHDGNKLTGPGREKGRINLINVKAVERVDEESLGRAYAFQVVYLEPTSSETYTLYIVCRDSEQRDKWMHNIREAASGCNASFRDKYHPGVWQGVSGRYSCCFQINKKAAGCQQAWTPSNGPIQANHSPMYTHGLGPLPQIPTPNAQSSQKKKCVALYDYECQEVGDLSLVKGEEYEILNDEKPYWWNVVNPRGEIGLIPANYVQIVDSLATYDWYYKDCSRQQSEEILRRENKEGCFLVRDSSSPGMYTLSLFTKQTLEGLVKHYHIKMNENKEYYLSQNHPKKNIPELINYHKHNAGGLVVRLRSPPSDRQHNGPPVAVFSAEWELDKNDFVIDSEPLGSGQFGMVYKARWTSQRCDVAIKMMRENTMSEDDFVEEGMVMKELKHFNLVNLYGVCTRSKPIYLVTEYMKNGALLTYMKRHKLRLARQISILLDMCIQVCKAMEYLESKGFIHRDLAARNCLVGENYTVKVGDFGLARFVLDDEYTSSSGTKFPIKWSPPEVLGFTKFSTKSDVWAFGVLMWEIYTCGDMPYGRMKNPDVVDYVSHQKRRLSKPPYCPEEVYEVMLQCWMHDREDRPPFRELLPLLEQMQDYVQ